MSQLLAGRELDALVAEKVLGWTLWDGGFPVLFWLDQEGLLTGWCDSDWPDRDDLGDAPELFSGKGVWKPLDDIAVAWVVVDKLAERGWHLTLYTPGSYTDEGLGPGKGYTALFYHATEDWYECKGAFEIETAPLAICLAALEVKSQKENNDS